MSDARFRARPAAMRAYGFKGREASAAEVTHAPFHPERGVARRHRDTVGMDDLRERRPRKSRLPHAPPEAGSQQEPSATRSIAAAFRARVAARNSRSYPWPAWGFPGLAEALKAHNRGREPDFSLWSRRPGAAGSGRAADEAAIRAASGGALVRRFAPGWCGALLRRRHEPYRAAIHDA